MDGIHKFQRQPLIDRAALFHCLDVAAPNPRVYSISTLGAAFAGEAVFVPRHPSAAVRPSSEDDGFLLAYVHDEGMHRTQVRMGWFVGSV